MFVVVRKHDNISQNDPWKDRPFGSLIEEITANKLAESFNSENVDSDYDFCSRTFA